MKSYPFILLILFKDDNLKWGDKPEKTCVILCHSRCHAKKSVIRSKDDASNIAQAYFLTYLSSLSYLFISIKRYLALDCKLLKYTKKRSNRNSYIRKTADRDDKYDIKLKQTNGKAY